MPICDACKITNNGSSVLHGHQHFIMTFITRGRGIQTLNGKDIPFEEGHLFLLSPADFHKNTLPAGESFDYYRLCFSYELLDTRLSGLFASGGLPLHLQLSPESAVLAGSVFDRLTDESENGQERIGHNIYLQALAEELLILVLRELPQNQSTPPSTPVNRALGYVHAHFHEPISVADAAAIAGYTPNYFNSCFRSQMGIPFGEYLRNMRLSYAENLLRASSLPVTEIAFESGFASLSHFSRSFREKYGCAPQEYRCKISKEQ
jgi:AraC-like DNA-binding protein